jgi:hypothetical protein
MPGQKQSRTQPTNQQLGESARRTLPAWESFPVEDRHRVVRTILQAARRQVETRPTNSHPRR